MADTLDLSKLKYDGTPFHTAREKFEMTIDDVETETGVSRDLVYRAETNRNIPNGEDLLKLILFYKIEPSKLLK